MGMDIGYPTAVIAVFLGAALALINGIVREDIPVLWGIHTLPDSASRKETLLKFGLTCGLALIYLITAAIIHDLVFSGKDASIVRSLWLYRIVLSITGIAITGALVLIAAKEWSKKRKGKSYKKFLPYISISFLVVVSIILVMALFFPPESVESSSIEPPVVESIETPSVDGEVSSSQESTHGYYTDRRIGNASYTGWLKLSDMSPDGEGTMRYPNGDVYKGDWVAGVRTGVGTLWYNNGDVYDGEWENGQRHGYGNYTWSDSKKYEGYYRNNLRHGNGTFTGWEDVTNGWKGTYVGMNEGDKFEGYGEFKFDNGDLFVGVFKANVRWTGIYTYADGATDKIENGERIL